MDCHDIFDALVGELAALLGLPIPAGSGEVRTLAIDQRLLVHLSVRPGRGQLVLLAALGSPPFQPAQLFEALLKANAQGGVVLAFDAGQAQLVAIAHHPLETLDASLLEQRLRRFVDEADHWREQIAGWEAATPAPLQLPFDRA